MQSPAILERMGRDDEHLNMGLYADRLSWEDDADHSTMLASNRRAHNIMDQANDDLPSVLSGTSVRRRNRLLRSCDLKSLQELDETVMSIMSAGRKIHAGISTTTKSERPHQDDDTLFSLTTQDEMSAFTDQLLDEAIGERKIFTLAASTSFAHDGRSNGRADRRTKKKKARRKRGGSLERLIHDTILLQVALEEKDETSLHHIEDDLLSEASSTHFILQDLDQSSLIAENEVLPVITKAKNPPKTKKYDATLPPLRSDTYRSEDELDFDFTAALSQTTSRENVQKQAKARKVNDLAKSNELLFQTPNTSDETSTVSPEQPLSLGSFGTFDEHGFPVTWASSVQVEPKIMTPLAKDATAPSLSNALFPATDDWIAFRANPFADTDSVSSPSSVADFSHVRQWKRRENGWKTRISL